MRRMNGNTIGALVCCVLLVLTASSASWAKAPALTEIAGSFVGKEGNFIDSDWIITLRATDARDHFCEDRTRNDGPGRGNSCRITNLELSGNVISFAVSNTATFKLKVSADGSELKGKVTRSLKSGKTKSKKVLFTRSESRSTALRQADSMDQAEVARRERAAEKSSTFLAVFSGLTQGLSGAPVAPVPGSPANLTALMQQSAQKSRELTDQLRQEQAQEAQRRAEKAERDARELRRLQAARQQYMATVQQNARLQQIAEQQKALQQQQMEIGRKPPRGSYCYQNLPLW